VLKPTLLEPPTKSLESLNFPFTFPFTFNGQLNRIQIPASLRYEKEKKGSSDIARHFYPAENKLVFHAKPDEKGVKY
jgi:hypothetical protein